MNQVIGDFLTGAGAGIFILAAAVAIVVAVVIYVMAVQDVIMRRRWLTLAAFAGIPTFIVGSGLFQVFIA